MIRRIIPFILITIIPFVTSAQTKKKPVAEEAALYFSLTAEKNGKRIVIVKDNGRSVRKDSLRMADMITAYYKVGQKTSNVKDISYDSYFLSDSIPPTILQDMSGVTFDASIWQSCIDSLKKKEQVVFQIREITLDDGTKIQNPKLAKDAKAVYIVKTDPNFPAGGWEAKSKRWMDNWKDWFRIKDNNYYTLDNKTLELYATGFVITIASPPAPASKEKGAH